MQHLELMLALLALQGIGPTDPPIIDQQPYEKFPEDDGQYTPWKPVFAGRMGQIGVRVIEATQNRYVSQNKSFNIDQLRIEVLSTDRAMVRFVLSAAAKECSGLSPRDGPWLHLDLITRSGRRYPLLNVMELSVADPRAYFLRERELRVGHLKDVLPLVDRVDAGTGGDNCKHR